MSYKCFTKVLKESFNGDLPYFGLLNIKFNHGNSNNTIAIQYGETGVVKSSTPFTFGGNTYTELTINNVGENTLTFASDGNTVLTLEKYNVRTLNFNSGIYLIDFDTASIKNSGLNKLFVLGNSENEAYFDLEDFENFLQIRYYNTNGTVKGLDIANVAQFNPNITELTIGSAPDLYGNLEDYLVGMFGVRTSTEKLKFDVHYSNIKFHNNPIPWNLKAIFTSTTITVMNGEETTTFGTYTQGSGWSY